MSTDIQVCVRASLPQRVRVYPSFRGLSSLPVTSACLFLITSSSRIMLERLLSYIMDTEYTLSYLFDFTKTVPTCPACCMAGIRSSSVSPAALQERAQATSKGTRRGGRNPQALTDPFPLRYCVAKKYTSEDSFLLASGFTVFVFWNSSVSLFCNRWL